MIPSDSIEFKGKSCFAKHWVGVDPVKPINVIIGRNNSGKSQLLNLVETMCDDEIQAAEWSLQCHTKLDETTLRSMFSESYSGGDLGGNHWIDHGRHLIDRTIVWKLGIDEMQKLKITDETEEDLRTKNRIKQARISRINANANATFHRKLHGRIFRRLVADRDIRVELPDNTTELESDGTGATNLIRKLIVSSNDEFPHELIQVELLGSLNKIFKQDARFTDIQVKLHDDEQDSKRKDHWEIYLGEDKKRLVSLSNSGSGLKTVILVLLNLLAIPRILRQEKSKFVFAFEELENNLHPSLLRNLLQFIETYTRTEEAIVFLTTHSSTTLDVFGISDRTNITHVIHDGEAAITKSVDAHLDRVNVISKLGCRASDLLQSNGIIWVEGPSDRIYLNRWIQIFSGGSLQEGRHYQCVFYGGSLLARTQFRAIEDSDPELANLFQANPNIVVICDGDRSSKGSHIKARVRRIRDEVRRIPGAHIWITDAREIENYLPSSVLGKVFGRRCASSPERYEKFFPRKGSRGISFIQTKLGGVTIDKMDLAISAVEYMEKDEMETRFEWKRQMTTIVNRVNAWNS